jgi:hypothetical protein
MGDKKPEEWVYLGQHPDGSHVWRDVMGKDRWFDGLKARQPGARYRLDVRRDDGDKVVASPDPVYVGPVEDAEDRANIVARSLDWRNRREADALERREKRLGEIDAAAADVVALVGRIIEYSHKKAVADYVYARMMRA